MEDIDTGVPAPEALQARVRYLRAQQVEDLELGEFCEMSPLTP